MSDGTTVYDLGVVESITKEVTPNRTRRAAADAPVAVRQPLEMVADSCSLFIPGAGQLLRANWTDGLFVLSGAGFLLAFGWAILETLERLPETLAALSLPPYSAVYALSAVYVGLAWLHTGGILCGATRGQARAHPALAGCASVLFPGWGQLLNGQPIKAAAFVGALWIGALIWLLTSAWGTELLQGQGVGLRASLDTLHSPAILWTIPAVLWVLSVYDAVASARR